MHHELVLARQRAYRVDDAAFLLALAVVILHPYRREVRTRVLQLGQLLQHQQSGHAHALVRFHEDLGHAEVGRHLQDRAAVLLRHAAPKAGDAQQMHVPVQHAADPVGHLVAARACRIDHHVLQVEGAEHVGHGARLVDLHALQVPRQIQCELGLRAGSVGETLRHPVVVEPGEQDVLHLDLGPSSIAQRRVEHELELVAFGTVVQLLLLLRLLAITLRITRLAPSAVQTATVLQARIQRHRF